MSLLQTVREILASPNATASSRSNGAYWCHDCNERIPDVDVDGEEPPACPACGEEMAFERSATADCAC